MRKWWKWEKWAKQAKIGGIKFVDFLDRVRKHAVMINDLKDESKMTNEIKYWDSKFAKFDKDDDKKLNFEEFKAIKTHENFRHIAKYGPIYTPKPQKCEKLVVDF